MKRNILACLGLLCFVAVPAGAQKTPQSETTPPSAPEFPSRSLRDVRSLSASLRMQVGQIRELNRLYDAYASRREKQEATIAQWQNQLRQAQAPTSFDQDKASRLLEDINEARQKIVRDLLSSRFKALKVLTPVQRSQLEALASDERMSVPADRYYQLLLMPVDDLWQLRLDNGSQQSRYAERASRQEPERNSRQRLARNAGSGSYGVYGGYSYGGPNYGVYGSYGQGSIGVHAGIGRGGPSIGIGIGRVFGGLFGGRHRGY